MLSSSDLLLPAGSSQCMQTVISPGFNLSTIVEAGVQTCFMCLFDGAVDPNTQWRILDNFIPNPINPSDGQVNNGVLTIFDPMTIVPLTGLQNQRTLQCDLAGVQVQFYQIHLSRRGMHCYVRMHDIVAQA